jgi:hypothetical protein
METFKRKRIMTLKNRIKYFINDFSFLRTYSSPFKPLKLNFYCGKIALGTPYFFPRKWVKGTPKLINDAVLKHIEREKRYNELNPNHARTIKSYSELYEEKKSYSYAVPKKIGFDFVRLGWKTKYDDYRFEWSPMISFVFFKWQIAVTFVAPHLDHYWESWLYYTRETKGTTAERIAQCRKEAPQTWTSHNSDGTKETINYYDLILKKKWL